MEVSKIIGGLVVGFILSCLFTGLGLPILKKKQFRQYEREEGPDSHKKKSGTPTMGGIFMIASMLITLLVFGSYSHEMWIMFLMTLLFGLIGFADDIIKLLRAHNLGLRGWQKLVLQIGASMFLAMYVKNSAAIGSFVYIPFKGEYVDFGNLYIPFAVIVMLAMSNSVNLTDGLDGLCSGVTAISSVTFAFLALGSGLREEAAYGMIICGVCLGFLVFNRHPAKLFMGDTGSMALGGALASVAILTGMEIMLLIAGFIYVMESASVIIQVISFKSTGKRVFRMSPIHHHFELGGMREEKVTLLFCFIAAISGIIAYCIYII
jgi:phospho-N-acetylmuramoyl-pentapeptide-transferase